MAKKLRKKAVFCVDNLNSSCSVENIKSFVSKLSVEVLTCFEVKPRRRRDESVVNRKAFRLCINGNDRQKLLNACMWPDSVIIREWYFKQNSNEDGNDKRLRIGTSPRSGNAADGPPTVPGIGAIGDQASDVLMTSSDETITAAAVDNFTTSDGH